ncbi:unnamed protein product [Didymodactylos carnosus]|uniref:Uncharacterized protein n=1 Tax=Didymodactylos carnosus TaxID=1234261 RepID=A0A8S2S1R4_9BILA|nr:unnamed protein product [Didymodactylos carnosus]CAF4193037.1 unnamed protein product [Didymodactylos carnosus]
MFNEILCLINILEQEDKSIFIEEFHKILTNHIRIESINELSVNNMEKIKVFLKEKREKRLEFVSVKPNSSSIKIESTEIKKIINAKYENLEINVKNLRIIAIKFNEHINDLTYANIKDLSVSLNKVNLYNINENRENVELDLKYFKFLLI